MYVSLYGISTLDNWLDANTSELYQRQPLAQDWARISKVNEEAGEAIANFIGATGQNPRKGTLFNGSMEPTIYELADTVFTAILAIQHFTKDEATTEEILSARWQYRLEKAGLTTL